MWRREQVACLSNIERLKAADQYFLEDGGRILELAKNARSLFDLQAPPREAPPARFPTFELNLEARGAKLYLQATS